MNQAVAAVDELLPLLRYSSDHLHHSHSLPLAPDGPDGPGGLLALDPAVLCLSSLKVNYYAAACSVSPSLSISILSSFFSSVPPLAFTTLMTSSPNNSSDHDLSPIKTKYVSLL